MPGVERTGCAELLAKAHWAIDKVTHDIEHGFQFHTAIAAVMELVNDAYRLKDDLYGDPAGDAALRFATATAASLIFPFAPHLGVRGLRGADRRARLGAALAAGRPELAATDDESRSSSRSTASAATRSRSPPTRPRTSCSSSPATSENVSRHLDGKQIVKEIVVPGKLVNLVVR